MFSKSAYHEGHEAHEELGFRNGLFHVLHALHGSFPFAIFVGLLALAPSSRVVAQVPAPQIPVMEFADVIRQATEKNPNVARAASSIVRAETLLQQARAITLPLVTTTVSNTTLDSARGFAGGITQPQNQFVFTASAGMTVLAASRWAGIGQARDQISVASASADEVRQQIAVAAAQTYLAVISARRQVEVSVRALESARAHLDYATKRFEGGAGSRLNQLRAAQVVSAEESRLEASRLALRSAQEALGVIVAAPTPIDAGAEPTFDMAGAMEDSAWMSARPDIVTQAAIQRTAERVVRDNWRDWMPVVNMSFDPTLLTPAGLFQPSRTWRFTITATQPIFEGGQRRIAWRLREIALDQARIGMSQLEIEARSEVRLAQETVLARERALESARRAAEQAGEVLRITTSAFEVGATTNLEVIDAQRSDRDARATAELAEDALRRARLDLLVAIGKFR
jgi:outer membrane protein TolC